jgi:serine phosphatase RsbU (regulator of sigma subunit)
LVFGFDELSLRDLAALCTAITSSAKGATTMQEAADDVVRCLRYVFGTHRHGRSDIILARAFQTVRYDALPPDLKEYVDQRMGPDEPPERCLVLLGTDGDLPEWCDRRLSRDHRAIPLSGLDAVSSMPMVSALVEDLGVSMSTFLHGGEGLDVHRLDRDFGVFFVPEARGSNEVPAQGFVREHGVESVLGFGGLLPGGDLFSIVLFTRTAAAPDVVHLFRTVAVAAKLALLTAATAPLFPGEPPRPVHAAALDRARIRALEQMLEVQQQTVTHQAAHLERALDEALRSRAEAQREAAANEVLREVTSTLSAELEYDRLVQAATDAATRISGARYGVFCAPEGQGPDSRHQVQALAGIAPEELVDILTSPAGQMFRPVFTRPRVLGQHGLGQGGLADTGDGALRSYMEVPVFSHAGDVHGAFLLGHPQPERFDERAERLVLGIAAQTSIALDNARLFAAQRHTALALQESLLPQQVAAPTGLEVGHEYLAGGYGVDVGGDWYDVIPISGGRTAFVIGDVMGKGVKAAAVMGQLRTAIRAYTVTDLPPGALMSRLNRLVLDMGDDLIATCVYAVLDQTDGTLTMASSGHMPPAFVHPGGSVELAELPLGPPLGVEGAVHTEQQVPFPVGSRMLLYTDGLVEHRERDLADGLTDLVARLDVTTAPCAVACKEIITALMDNRTQDDDITLLMVANVGLSRKEHVRRAFAPDPGHAAQVRAFVESSLTAWGDTELVIPAVSVVNELYINAVAHARTAITLHLRRLPHMLIAEVEDLDGHEPRRSIASPEDEHHRGLQIVEAFSTRWGTRRTATGKVVWAEFAVPR